MMHRWVYPLALLALAAGAALALAGKGSGTDARIKAKTVDAGAVDGYAKCPKRTRAVGGGILPLGPASRFRIRSSGPLDATGSTLATDDGDKARQWYADGTGPDDFKVYALCSKRSDARIEATSVPISDQGGQGQARCPGKRRAVGGGVVWSQNPGVIRLTASAPLGRTGGVGAVGDGDKPKRWLGAVENPTGPNTLIKVFAICSKESKARIQTTAFEVAGGESDGQVAPCGGGRRVTGGGFAPVGEPGFLQSGASGPRNDSFTAAGTKTGDRATHWFAEATSFGLDRPFKVMAICE